MAENKKGFILYADLAHTFEHLSNEQRGEVIWWVLQYVNDCNPEPLKGLLAAVTEPIKQQLKRDLKKYEARSERARENGRKGGRPKGETIAYSESGKVIPTESKSKHFVYLLVDKGTGCVKVGETKDLKKRILSIRKDGERLSVKDVSVLDFITTTRGEAIKAEKYILDGYTDYSIGGEWFNADLPIGQIKTQWVKFIPKKPDTGTDTGTDTDTDTDTDSNNKQLLTKSDFDFILKEMNSIFSRKFKVISEATKGKYKARIREGFTVDDIVNSMKVVFNDEFHRENNFKYITPDYFSRYKTLTMHSEELVKVSGTDKLTEKAKQQIELYGNIK